MKKQLTTAILFAFILLSCKKESVNEQVKNEDLKILNSPPPGGTITLQAITLHSGGKVDISFGWENNGGFQVHDIRSSGGGGGGIGIGWAQGQSFWSNDPTNPDIIDMIIVGTYTYLVGGRFGADKVKEAVFIQIFYNIKTHVQTTVVSSTNSTIIR